MHEQNHVELSREESAGFERPPTFLASDLLPKELLVGPHHVVMPEVVNDGYMNIFTVRSPYGDFQTISQDGVSLRIRECEAIAQLSNVSTTSTVSSTAQEAGKSLVLAPVRAVEKLADRVSDPSGTWEMIRGVPGGIAAFFERAAATVADGSKGVYDAGRSAVQGDTGTTGERLAEGAEFVGRHGARYLGIRDRRMEWYKDLQLDPYSHNEPLRAEIDRLNRVGQAVDVAFKFIPGLWAIPHVGDINRAFGYAERVSAYDDPKALRDDASSVLLSLNIPEEKVAAFLKNASYVPPLQKSVALYLQDLDGVQNKSGMVEILTLATSRIQAIVLSHALRDLAQYHQTNERLIHIIEEVRLPAAVSTSHRLIVPLPVDHLVWTQTNALLFSEVETRVKTEHKIESSELVIAGTISKRAFRELSALGIDRIVSNGIRG